MQKDELKTLVESNTFQLFIAAIIFFNAITIGCETLPVSSEAFLLLNIFDWICLGIYIVEAALKLRAYGWDYFKDGWNIFDFSIVVLSLAVIILGSLSNTIAFPIQIIRTIRLLRVVRVFKLVSLFPKLRIITEAIGKSIPGVLWTCVFLFIVMYVFDVAGVFIYSEDFPEYFGDMAAGLLTLFQILTLEGWPDIARPIIQMYPAAWLFFVPFIVLTAFIILNIIVGIILDTIEETRQAARVAPGATKAQLATELDDLKAQIETVQRLLDKVNAESAGAGVAGASDAASDADADADPGADSAN